MEDHGKIFSLFILNEMKQLKQQEALQKKQVLLANTKEVADSPNRNTNLNF